MTRPNNIAVTKFQKHLLLVSQKDAPKSIGVSYALQYLYYVEVSKILLSSLPVQVGTLCGLVEES